MIIKMLPRRQRERLQAREGERCLLHTAAKYGQVRFFRWGVTPSIDYLRIEVGNSEDRELNDGNDTGGWWW